MTARRRGGPRLSAPLAILAGVIITVTIGHLLAVLILAAVTGLAAGAAYVAGVRRAVTRRARPAALQPRTAPAKTGHGAGRLAGPAASPDELAALRATLRARADQVSQGIPAAGKPRERSS